MSPENRFLVQISPELKRVVGSPKAKTYWLALSKAVHILEKTPVSSLTERWPNQSSAILVPALLLKMIDFDVYIAYVIRNQYVIIVDLEDVSTTRTIY